MIQGEPDAGLEEKQGGVVYPEIRLIAPVRMGRR